MGERGGWGLSPVGWAVAYAAAGLELGNIFGLWRPLAALGVVHVPISAVPASLLLIAFGPRLFSDARRWLPFVLWAGVIAAVPAWCFRDLFGGPVGVAGYAVAAVHEEVVFRAALPLLVWRLLDRADVGPAWSRAGAVLVPACVFAVLPGHLRQTGSGIEVLPFFTFAVFFGLLVRRPSVLLPAALAHLTVNVLTVPVNYGLVSPVARMLAVAALLSVFAAVALWIAGDPEPVTGPRPAPAPAARAGGAAVTP